MTILEEVIMHHEPPFSWQQYCGYAQWVAKNSMQSGNGPLWWTKGEIRVSWEHGIPERTVELITKAVKQRLRELCGLQFAFKLFGQHESFVQQLRKCIAQGQVDHEKLFTLASVEKWRDEACGGQQHADIYITTKPFLGDRVSWGAADFNFGVMFFALHGQRHLRESFLHTIALHEAGHLAGIGTHCEYLPVKGQVPCTCNMNSNLSSDELCSKCKEYFRVFWETINQEYGMYLCRQAMDESL